jgi:hypothetical protein
MRNSYGFAVVLGRPVPDALLEWFKVISVDTAGINWHPHESIHATLLNCTRPIARSVSTIAEALKYADNVRKDALSILLPYLASTLGLTLQFQNILFTDQAVILPSFPTGCIADLKIKLQGGRAFVSKEDAENVLSLPDVLGINKFNTYKDSMQSTVHLTLGVKTASNIKKLKVTEPPLCHVTSLRLVLYRDRTLTNAVVSNPLMFGLPSDRQLENIVSIEAFFEKIYHKI